MNKLVFAIGIAFLFLILTSCNGCSSKTDGDTSYLDGAPAYSNYEEDTKVGAAIGEGCVKIAYTEMYDNTISIPVKINGIGLDMIFDTGASSTCITLAEAQYLYEKGNLIKDDIVDVQRFQTADGSISVGLRIILRDVSIGDKINLHNIEAIVIENQQAPLLLGQSAMKQFREISVDRENRLVKFFE